MAVNRQVIPPNLASRQNAIAGKVSKATTTYNLIVNFSEFKLKPICLHGKFNNHFKDNDHFSNITSGFLGVVLPKITSHTYNEVCEGSAEGKSLHFHTLDESHRKIVRDILEEYHFPDYKIDQILEGNCIFEFSAALGHVYAARIVCHKVDNVLYPLFFDTNHHIYMNEKFVKESLFYENCPVYLNGNCSNMPIDCFAVSYLDETLLGNSFGYSFSP